MKLTVKNLKAKNACEPGMAWITPILESAPETAADRLALEHPIWLQWAHSKGFDLDLSPDVIERQGVTYTKGQLRFFQTAGDWSTQTAGDWSTQTAGDWSTQTAGHCSTQTAGGWSTQTAGHCSTQTAGSESRHRLTGGAGVFICRHYDGGWKMNAVVCDGTTLKHNVFYSFDIASQTWVESANQEAK